MLSSGVAPRRVSPGGLEQYQACPFAFFSRRILALEEPPDGVVFVFCTTDPSQIRPAVVSRLQRFTFRPLQPEEIEGKLARILAAEGRRAEPAAVALVARLAAGGMRDAESMLDQVLAAHAADRAAAKT